MDNKKEKTMTDKNEFNMGLLAIDGDCGGGMSDHHDFIILNGDHFDKVSAYLSYELKSSLLLPLHKKDTMETNISRIYLAGVICGGLKTNKWFIENSRVHAETIINHIKNES